MADNTNTPSSKKRLPPIKPIWVLIVLVILVAGFGVYKLTHKHQGFPVVIGNTTITKQDVTSYAAQITAYKKINPNTQFGGSATQVAVDDLVLNAAFKQEAQKLHKSLTDAELIPPGLKQYYNTADTAKFITTYHTESKMLQVRTQNQAYESLLSDSLIIKKNLMVAGIGIDTPYFNQAPKAQVQTLYNQAKARLQNTVVPLLKQKASDSELSKHVDLTFKNGYLIKGNNNYQMYFHQSVLSIDEKIGYTADQTLFNDQKDTSYIRGNVGKLYSTKDKINSLKNVGDYTDVFTSKSGVLMVIRLDSKNKGTYNTWDDFLNHYKQQYHLTSKSMTKQLGTKVSGVLNNAISSLASIGSAQVSADVPGGCSQHNVQFTARSWDMTANAPIGGGGTKFHEFRPVGSYPCPGTVQGNAYATTGGPNNTIDDNCFSPPPSWGVDSLVGGSYTPVSGGPYTPNTSGVTWDNSAGGQSVAIRSGQNANCFGGGNYDGFPQWDPGHINDTGHIYICFLYRGTPPTGSGGQPSGGGGSNSIQCNGFSAIADAGATKTFWVTDDTGNVEVTQHTTTPGGTSSWNFTPLGQVMTLHAYEIDSAGRLGPTHTWDTSAGGPCYKAQCSMYVDGNLPDGGVLAGSTYTVHATIYNTGPNTLLANMPGARGTSLGLTMGGSGGPGPGVDIGPGGSANFTFTRTAGGPGTDSVSGYPDYYNDFGLGPACDTGTFSIETRSASCTIDSVTGPINPGGYVQAGQDFTVTATITNTGTSELANNDGGNPFSFNHGDNSAANSYWNFPDQNLAVNLFPGQSVTITFTQNANLPSPPNPAQETLWGHVAYSNDVALGGQCSANINMYVPFNLTGGASSTPNPSIENPSSFNYKTWVHSTAPVPVDGPSSSTAYKQPTGTSTHITIVPAVNSNGPYGPNADTYILNSNAPVLPPLKAGDAYYAEIDLGYTSAYVGANGPDDIVGATGPQPFANDFVVTNRPYFKVYNGSISAGGYEKTSSGFCSATGAGNIGSWNDNSGTYPPLTNFGAGSALSALAGGLIEGFASGQTPSSATAYSRSPTELSFANNGAGVNTTGSGTDGRAYSPYLGGNFGNATHCLPDVAPPTGVTPVAGPVTIPATAVSGNQTKFVNGDVYITGNITNGSSSSLHYVDGNTPTPGESCASYPHRPGRLPGYFCSSTANLAAASKSGALGGPFTPPAGYPFCAGADAYFINPPGIVVTYYICSATNIYKVTSASDPSDAAQTCASPLTAGEYICIPNTPAAGFVPGSAPSLVVHATGNIYIAPNVTELAGLYISQSKIYTCVPPGVTAPLSSSYLNSIFGSCNNQLTVYGNFVAKQVDMMRTYGSLRNEAPTSATPAASMTKNGSGYDPGGCVPYPPGTYPCTTVASTNGVYAYQEYASTYTFTALPASSDYKLTVNYSNFNANSNSPWPPTGNYSPPNYNYIVEVIVNGVSKGDQVLSPTGPSYTLDVGPLPANPTVTLRWKNNYWLDTGSNQNAYDPNFEINSVTLTSPPTSATPLTALTCSNAGARSSPRLTCAAEVFDFSPELYLSSPAIKKPGSSVAPWDAVTSLPPVL